MAKTMNDLELVYDRIQSLKQNPKSGLSKVIKKATIDDCKAIDIELSKVFPDAVYMDPTILSVNYR